jgi:hypothetical protein
MLKLAALCGSLESFQVAHDRPDKYYMQEMERIVRGDSALDSTKLDAFSLFKAYETFSERFPLLFYGFEIKLRPAIRAFYNYSRLDPFRSDSTITETDVTYNPFKNPIQLGWILPVTSRLFLEAVVEPPLSDDEKLFYHSGGIAAYFMMTNRILINASISEIPTFILAPCRVPGRYELTMYIYLEDRLMLRFYGFKQMRPSDALLSDYDSKRDQNEGIQMQVRYDF